MKTLRLTTGKQHGVDCRSSSKMRWLKNGRSSVIRMMMVLLYVLGLEDEGRPHMVATTAWGLGPTIQGVYRSPFRGGDVGLLVCVCVCVWVGSLVKILNI